MPKIARTILTGWAVAQAELLGALIVIAYKAFTGRAHPAHNVGADISHVFHFGWLRGGVFWGWPSSHTTIAFAMAVTVFTLYPKQRWLGLLAILYAFYVGIGVSMTIHWFSDFVAGAIIGSVIGTVVGKNFWETSNIEHPNTEHPMTGALARFGIWMLKVRCWPFDVFHFHFTGYCQTQSPFSVSTSEPPFLRTTVPPSSFSFQPTE